MKHRVGSSVRAAAAKLRRRKKLKALLVAHKKEDGGAATTASEEEEEEGGSSVMVESSLSSNGGGEDPTFGGIRRQESFAESVASGAREGRGPRDGGLEATPLSLRHVVAPGEAALGHALAAGADPERARKFFEWVVAPVGGHEFWEEVHERRPVHVSRSNATYYDGWFSRGDVDGLLRARKLEFTRDLDVTRYVDGQRQTLNGRGTADAAKVWDHFTQGCSIRLSWPQRTSDAVWRMVSLLEEHAGCGGGCNAYLTPAGNQGFAPHYDDVDAFVLQIEGTKEWLLYKPRCVDEALPRHSSPNFRPGAIGEAVASFTLRPGDLLYLPRGYIHQARATDSDSFHLTLSMGHLHTWRDFLQHAVDTAVDVLGSKHLSWRQGLPRDHLDYLGAAATTLPEAAVDDRRRPRFEHRLRTMLTSLAECVDADAAADAFAARAYVYDRLPPPPPAPRRRAPEDVALSSRIRLVARRCVRLSIEGDVACLYYSTHNNRVFHADDEPKHVDFALDAAEPLCRLITAFPDFIAVRDLPSDDDDQKIDIAQALVEIDSVILLDEGE